MKKTTLVFALFTLFFAVSCDSGVKFENPKDKNSDAYDPEAVENDDDEDTETNDEDTDSEDSAKYYSESNRVVIQLGSKQGYKSREEMDEKEGVQIDLDLHLVKKTSLEAEKYRFDYKNGLLGTQARNIYNSECPATWPECEKYWRHDDCSFSDSGILDESIEETIAWNAQFIYDNTWGGGGNYENPETIALGSTKDEINNVTGEKTPDGLPDAGISEDQYLVVASYVNCMSRYDDGFDRCDPYYDREDGTYEIDARVRILVDGEEVPRDADSGHPADNYSETTKDFKLKYGEWKVVAVIKWDNSMQGPLPELKGNAIVTDVAMPRWGITTDPVSYPVCTFDNADSSLVPIWDPEEYVNHITIPNIDGIVLGECDYHGDTDTDDTDTDDTDTDDTDDTDTNDDSDIDLCPDDFDKTEPGICGCGLPDDDYDGDGIMDCIDNCPSKYNPGQEDSNPDTPEGDACETPIVDPTTEPTTEPTNPTDPTTDPTTEPTTDPSIDPTEPTDPQNECTEITLNTNLTYTEYAHLVNNYDIFNTTFSLEIGSSDSDLFYMNLRSSTAGSHNLAETNWNDETGVFLYICEDSSDGCSKIYFQRKGFLNIANHVFNELGTYLTSITVELTGVVLEEISNGVPVAGGACFKINDTTLSYTAE